MNPATDKDSLCDIWREHSFGNVCTSSWEKEQASGTGAALEREGRRKMRERLLHIGAGLISSTRLTSHLFGSICRVQIFSVPQQWALPRQKIKTQEQNAGGRKELWH